eukprot:Filipodium_phascolosomae@DN8467_c0_g1_i1.p1
MLRDAKTKVKIHLSPDIFLFILIIYNMEVSSPKKRGHSNVGQNPFDILLECEEMAKHLQQKLSGHFDTLFQKMDTLTNELREKLGGSIEGILSSFVASIGELKSRAEENQALEKKATKAAKLASCMVAHINEPTTEELTTTSESTTDSNTDSADEEDARDGSAVEGEANITANQATEIET